MTYDEFLELISDETRGMPSLQEDILVLSARTHFKRLDLVLKRVQHNNYGCSVCLFARTLAHSHTEKPLNAGAHVSV